MKTKITKKQVLKFLKEHSHASIATVTEDGMPEVATIYYGVDDHLNFYIPTGTLSRKFKNIEKNPHVALAITDLEQLTTVQIEGVASVALLTKKSLGVIKILSKALSPSVWGSMKSIFDSIPPVIKMKNGLLVILKVEIKWARWADFTLPVSETKGQYYQQLRI